MSTQTNQGEYYRNYLSGMKILRYMPETGEHEELWSARCPKDELSKGFYVRVGDDFYGVYASPKGPMCFHNELRFPLADEQSHIEWIKGDGENQFILYWKGEKQFAVIYPFPDPDLSWGEWSATDEDDDFFLWLMNNYQEGDAFFKFYTTTPR